MVFSAGETEEEAFAEGEAAFVQLCPPGVFRCPHRLQLDGCRAFLFFEMLELLFESVLAEEPEELEDREDREESGNLSFNGELVWWRVLSCNTPPFPVVPWATWPFSLLVLVFSKDGSSSV